MLTETDIDSILDKVYLIRGGFAIDGIDAVDVAEQLFGKADFYGVDEKHIITAYWFED